MGVGLPIGKIFYAVLFCVFLPFTLTMWAKNVNVPIAIGDWKIAGVVFSIGGLIFMVWGMFDLWHYGKGLPMNAYPPKVYVQSGAYVFFNHPIYFGFCSTCAGVSCWFNSPSGLFLITPVVILGCWALVMGYEQPDLQKRFGDKLKSTSIFQLIEEDSDKPTASEKLKAAVAIFLPWFLLYETFIFLGVSNYFVDTVSTPEKSWPIWEWTEIPYLSIYFFAGIAPFFQKTKSDLRVFMLNAWWTTGIGCFLLLILPLYATQRPVTGENFLAKLMIWERSVDSMAAAFPSFHVIWAFVACGAWSKVAPKLKWFFQVWAILISISCSTTGNHSVADIVAGFAVVLIVANRRHIWRKIQSQCEELANSWKSFQMGSLRVINHSLYAGLAGFVGIFLVAQFVADTNAILVVTFATLLGGAIWGQAIEGSSIMLRPFGYYGAIAGGVLGVLTCQFFLHTSSYQLITAFALASPVIQGIGRLRCLVQGCCHGAITSPYIGIVYINVHSRVCQISGMKGVPLHNTQLYSIFANFIIGTVLWRLWFGGTSVNLLLGLYFMLSGIARFVEEAYRGEPQTKTYLKLRMYQWLAIAFLIIGAVITAAPVSEPLILNWSLSVKTIGVCLISGLSSAFAMGMDFPKSKIPFSRLTG